MVPLEDAACLLSASPAPQVGSDRSPAASVLGLFTAGAWEVVLRDLELERGLLGP